MSWLFTKLIYSTIKLLFVKTNLELTQMRFVSATTSSWYWAFSFSWFNFQFSILLISICSTFRDANNVVDDSSHYLQQKLKNSRLAKQKPSKARTDVSIVVGWETLTNIRIYKSEWHYIFCKVQKSQCECAWSDWKCKPT